MIEKNGNRDSFAYFGKNFQEALAAIAFKERAFCDRLEEVLQVDFFEPKYLKKFAQLLFDYRKKYKTHPTETALSMMLNVELDGEDDASKAQIHEYCSRLQSIDLTDAEYVKQTSIDFCKKQVLKAAMIKSVDLLKDSSFDEISKIINDALKLGLDTDVGYDYIKDFEKRYQPVTREPISTGWDVVDNITQGGLGKKEMTVVISPTGVGKTTTLCHLGAAAIKAGKFVVHYSLEMSEAEVGLKYDTALTHFNLRDLPELKDRVYEEIKDKNRLIIKEYPTKAATTNTIRNHLEKIRKKGIPIDLIIVDYGDLLKPISAKQETRHELQEIYEQLRALAQLYNCPIVTASQTHRSSVKEEVITMDAISEAFNKCFTADFIFTLSRTRKDFEKNTGRIYIAKNRHGPIGFIFPVLMEIGIGRIEVLPHDSTITIDAIAAASAKEQQRLLREKYREFSKGKTSEQTN